MFIMRNQHLCQQRSFILTQLYFTPTWGLTRLHTESSDIGLRRHDAPSLYFLFLSRHFYSAGGKSDWDLKTKSMLANLLSPSLDTHVHNIQPSPWPGATWGMLGSISRLPWARHPIKHWNTQQRATQKGASSIEMKLSECKTGQRWGLV